MENFEESKRIEKPKEENIELGGNDSLSRNASFDFDKIPKRKIQHVRTGSDFWSQIAEQTSYIDTGSSLLPSSHNDATQRAGSCSTPSLTVPSACLASIHQRYSVRDTKRNAKIARFLSHDSNQHERGDLKSLKMQAQSSDESRSSFTGVWSGVENNNKLHRKYTQKRKMSSWDESVSLQRRRSLAARDLSNLKFGSTPPIPPPLSSLAGLDTKDVRYCFQHPYLRFFTTLSVIFCNFLLFAEDPISHSHTESVIPLVGNVFSFVCTKYPPDWRWASIKVTMWIFAIFCGLIIGKLFIHSLLFRKYLRLKMFRDEQGSWMAMFLTVILSLYMFSFVYNFVIDLLYKKDAYLIDSRMGLSNSTVMKAAACGTWLGDLITLLMVTDVMLQDSLYPDWAPAIRKVWRSTNYPRILMFWVGSALCTGLVVTLIVSDLISWDMLNRDYITSTELSRAFLASFILVLDLMIMMQDWDFPHFTTTVHINLPGFSVATLEWKYAEVNLTGKWFSYGVIFMVMMLDLNMWKNQIFYTPVKFGQYTGPQNKIHTILDIALLQTGNSSYWTYAERSKINETSKLSFLASDMKMNSRFKGYPLWLKCTAFIPSIVTLSLFLWIIYLYGRFPHSKDKPNENENDDTEIESEEGVTV